MKNIGDYIQKVNFVALICYIVGVLLNLGLLTWIGLGIMTLSSIYTLTKWNENAKMTNYIAVAFLVLVALSLFRL